MGALHRCLLGRACSAVQPAQHPRLLNCYPGSPEYNMVAVAPPAQEGACWEAGPKCTLKVQCCYLCCRCSWPRDVHYAAVLTMLQCPPDVPHLAVTGTAMASVPHWHNPAIVLAVLGCNASSLHPCPHRCAAAGRAVCAAALLSCCPCGLLYTTSCAQGRVRRQQACGLGQQLSALTAKATCTAALASAQNQPSPHPADPRCT